MKINTIKIKIGEKEQKIIFDEKINLVHSKNNSCGKTTLLRTILYGLGYNIPATDGIKSFDNYYIEIECLSNNKEFIIRRHKDIVELSCDNDTITYVLPYQMIELHTLIFGIDNEVILNNLLAIFYIDQEKGWTLLNRGIIIGKNRFNVEDFITALSDKDVEHINNEIKKITEEIKKYKSLNSIAEYRNGLILDESVTSYKNNDDEMYSKEKYLILKREELISDIQEITNILRDNQRLVEYLERLEINIKISDTESIRVDKDNIVNFNENQIFYQTRKKELEIQLAQVKCEIDKIETELDSRNLVFNTKTVAEEIDAMIKEMDIKQIQIEKILKQLTRRRNNLTRDLKNILSNKNVYLNSIFENVKKYAKELGIGGYVKDSPDFILTDKLKGKTGRVLTQMCFIFKIAYVLEVKKKYNVILPLIIDSPRTSELTDESSTAMMKILERDFKEHQIIFASVYDFDDICKKNIEFEYGFFD